MKKTPILRIKNHNLIFVSCENVSRLWGERLTFVAPIPSS